MVKARVLRVLAGPNFTLQPGTVGEFDDNFAAALQLAGAIEYIGKPPAAGSRPQAEPIETAVIKAPEAAVRKRGRK